MSGHIGQAATAKRLVAVAQRFAAAISGCKGESASAAECKCGFLRATSLGMSASLDVLYSAARSSADASCAFSQPWMWMIEITVRPHECRTDNAPLASTSELQI